MKIGVNVAAHTRHVFVGSAPPAPLFTIHNNGGCNAIPLANIRWVDLYPHLYAIYALLTTTKHA